MIEEADFPASSTLFFSDFCPQRFLESSAQSPKVVPIKFWINPKGF
jgi:hypothetical protein